MPPSTAPEEQSIAEAERLLKERNFEGARVAAEPVFTVYQRENRALPPRLLRLFGVFVAAQNGDLESLKLLDLPLANPVP